jgi:hypothetical protein
MNSPTIKAISLTIFLSAYPRNRPPKNPPPIVKAVAVMKSVLKLQPRVDTILGYGCT